MLSSETISYDKEEVKRALVDVKKVCQALGLMEGYKPRGPNKVMIKCPWPGGHHDNTPSCSVSLDGIILANCFGCGRNGDVLSLIAAAHNLNLNDRRDFQKILSIGAEIAGLQPQNFLHQKKFHTSPIAINNTKETPIYPPEQEVINFWDECLPVNEDKDCWQIITSRFTEKKPSTSIKTYADRVVDRNLIRSIPGASVCPGWAQIARKNWFESGHKMVLQAFNHLGQMRSIRGWRVDNQTPKRVGPSGYNLKGLVLADALARQILETGKKPDWWPLTEQLTVVISEGEPDFVTQSVIRNDNDETAPACFGVFVHGGWSKEVSERIPNLTKVIIRTHNDKSGNDYFNEISDQLKNKCTIKRIIINGNL